jgi:hypothetical protein
MAVVESVVETEETEEAGYVLGTKDDWVSAEADGADEVNDVLETRDDGVSVGILKDLGHV